MKVLLVYGSPHKNGCTKTALDEIAEELKVPVLGKMPVEAQFAEKADQGLFHQVTNTYLEGAENHLPA